MRAVLGVAVALAAPGAEIPLDRMPQAVALDEGRVVWVAGERHHLTAFGAGRAPRRLPGTGESSEQGVYLDDFAVSRGRIAYALRVADRFYYPGVYEGSFDVAPTEVAGCTDDDSPGFGSLSVALTDVVFAFTFCQKVGFEYLPVELRDATASRRVAPVGVDVQASGPYVSWRAPAGLVVFDRTAGREAYRVERAAVPELARYALGADGTVLLGSGSGELAVASPAAPAPRMLPVRASGDLALVGDRAVAYEGRRYGRPGRLRLIGLDGSARTIVRFPAPRERPVTFGFDGARVAWASARCFGWRVHVAAVDGLDCVDRAGPCRTRLRSSELRARPRGRWIRALLRCPSAGPGRCLGTLRLLGHDGTLLARRPPRYVGGRALLRSTPAGQRLVRSGRLPLAVRLEIRERGVPPVTRVARLVRP